MHPLLVNVRRLALYLAAWVPLAGVLVYLFTTAAGLGWQAAAALVFPLCFLYAFVCLSALYPCRSTPLQRASLPRVAATHLTAAVLVSSLWLLLARVLAKLLARAQSLSTLDLRMSGHWYLLFLVGILLYLLAVAFHYVLLALEASRAAEKREMEARLLARDAELKALKAQVNPHFLFNSLHSISALTSIDPSRARDMCITLADFLRKTLGLGEKPVIALEDELLLLHKFLAVEKIRFGARLRVEEQVADAALPLLLPPLLLQPLVENAVTHGIANLPQGGLVRLEVKCDVEAGVLLITVENSFDPEAPPSRGRGMGLANVRQRLAARYGERASVNVTTDNHLFRVQLLLPAEAPAANTQTSERTVAGV